MADNQEPKMVEKLTKHLRGALREVVDFHDRHLVYWFRRASMQKLEALGLVEPWRPRSISDRRFRVLPYRPTAAGRQALDQNGGGPDV